MCVAPAVPLTAQICVFSHHVESEPISRIYHFVYNQFFHFRNSSYLVVSLGKLTLTRETPDQTVLFLGHFEVVGALSN